MLIEWPDVKKDTSERWRDLPYDKRMRIIAIHVRHHFKAMA